MTITEYTPTDEMPLTVKMAQEWAAEAAARCYYLNHPKFYHQITKPGKENVKAYKLIFFLRQCRIERYNAGATRLQYYEWMRETLCRDRDRDDHRLNLEAVQ